MRLSGFPKGLDNVHLDYEVPADALRQAVNVDITDSGKVRRRKGHALITAMTGAHSLWSDNLGNAYFMLANTLKALFTGGSTQNLGTVLAGDNKLSYVKVNESVYFSCASAKGKITNNVIQPWGIEAPTTPPVIEATVGILDIGTYHAAVTYVLADGRESGASVLTSVELTAAGGIAVIGMPIPSSTSVIKKRLYLSTANGEVLYLAKEMGVLDQFATISSPVTETELRTAYLSEPILSSCLAETNGRIFMVDAANKKAVYYTEAISFDHVDIRKNFYQFPEEVTLIAGTRTGLYVCADKTYYIANAGMDEASQTEIFDYTGIANSVQIIPSTHEPIWMTERGAVIGHDGGNAEILSSSSLVPGKMIDAASMVREQNGVRQYVVVGQQTEGSTVESSTYAEAEITRRAV